MYLFLYGVNSVNLTSAKWKIPPLNNQLSNTSNTAKVLDSENGTSIPTSTSFDICTLCWCKRDTIGCRRNDYLDALPIYPLKSEKYHVTEM